MMGDLTEKMTQNAKTSKENFNLRNEIKAYLLSSMQKLPNLFQETRFW